MEFPVPDLKFDQRVTGYARGQDGFEQILRAALSVLIEEGHKSLTIRKIAAKCGMNTGLVTYYFKSKSEIIRALLDAVVRSYEDVIDSVFERNNNDPISKFENLIKLILRDITTKKTTILFTELWAMSNHDPFTKDRLYDLYRREHRYFSLAISGINSDLDQEDCDVVATFIMGSLEGLTVFAGHEKPWRPIMPELETVACACFVGFIRDLKHEGIDKLRTEPPLIAAMLG